MRWLRERFRARLALRIYLVGLAQFAAVAAGFWAILTVTRPPGGGPADAHLRYIVGDIERVVDRPAQLRSEMARVSPMLCAPLSVLDPEGAVLAETVPGARRCEVTSSRHPIRHGLVVPATFAKNTNTCNPKDS